MAKYEELRPTIEYMTNRQYASKMIAIEQELRAMGANADADKVMRQRERMNQQIPKFMNSITKKTVVTAKQTEQGMVGHGRSGYKPTGNLMKSIEAHREGDTVKIYPNAVSKDGKAEYGGLVEYGTRKHPIPEPFMETAYEGMIVPNQTELDQFNRVMNGGA